MMTRIRNADERLARRHPMIHDTIALLLMLLAGVLIAIGLVLATPPAPAHATTEGSDRVIELPSPLDAAPPTTTLAVPRPATTATFGWVCGGEAFVQLRNDGNAPDLVSVSGVEVTVQPGTTLTHQLRELNSGEWALGPLTSITNQLPVPVNVEVDGTGLARTGPCFALWPNGPDTYGEGDRLPVTGSAHTADLIGAGLILCLLGTTFLYARRKLVRR